MEVAIHDWFVDVSQCIRVWSLIVSSLCYASGTSPYEMYSETGSCETIIAIQSVRSRATVKDVHGAFSLAN